MGILVLTGIVILSLLCGALPIVMWIKHPHTLEKRFESGAVISCSPGAEFVFPVVGMFLLVHSMFCVGHGKKLYEEYYTETGGKMMILFAFLFVLGPMLLSGIKNDYVPKDYLKRNLWSWLTGLPITGLYCGFNIILNKYPERFSGFDEYTMHEMLTRCIPCALIGSLIVLAVCTGVCVSVWYIRDRSSRLVRTKKDLR